MNKSSRKLATIEWIRSAPCAYTKEEKAALKAKLIANGVLKIPK